MMRWLLGATAGLIAVLFAAPFLVLAAALLLPVALAAVGDTQTAGHVTRAVLLFGIAAATPSLMALWETGHHMPDAIALATDPRALALCWAVQAAAWLLTQLVPVLLSLGLQRHAAQRDLRLRERRDALEAEWR